MFISAVRRLALRGFSPIYYFRKYLHVARNWRQYRLRRSRFFALRRVTDAKGMATAAAFEKKGWTPLHFDQERIQRVVERCRQIDAEAKPVQRTAGVGKDFWTVLFDTEQSGKYPDLVEFARDPFFSNVATLYFREEAVLSNVLLTHSFPTGRIANHSQLWHLDADDTKVLIFYVYCTDVDEESGPLVVAPRDAVKTRWLPRFLRKHGYSDADLQRVYKPREITTVTGKAGTLFACDTGNTLHYGSRCSTKHRLAFTFRYTSFSGLYAVQEVPAPISACVTFA